MTSNPSVPQGVNVFAVVAAAVVVLTLSRSVALSIRARLSGAPVGVAQVLGMKLRRSNAAAVVRAFVKACRADLGVTVRQLELHQLAGGDAAAVVSAMVAAKTAGVRLPWTIATAMDLAGQDVVTSTLAAIETGGGRGALSDEGVAVPTRGLE